MSEIELALTLNAIALGMDDKTFNNIKGFLDKLEAAFKDLIADNKRMHELIDHSQIQGTLTWDDVLVIKDLRFTERARKNDRA